MNDIIYNAIKTPDGTIIESRHRHDYQTYTDANGKKYMIDGGLSYIRCSANGDEEFLTVTLGDTHEKVREVCAWGTYGINGDQPLRYKYLCDMDTNHINAVLKNVPDIIPAIKIAMENEVKYRE